MFQHGPRAIVLQKSHFAKIGKNAYSNQPRHILKGLQQLFKLTIVVFECARSLLEIFEKILNWTVKASNKTPNKPKKPNRRGGGDSGVGLGFSFLALNPPP